jgi:hypothetical protein
MSASVEKVEGDKPAHTQEGIDCHATGEYLLIGHGELDYEGTKAAMKPKFALSIEMYTHACEYVDFVWSLKLASMAVELRLNCRNTHRLMGDGYADVIGFDHDGNLHVVDLKYGHREVEARDNAQLLIYAKAYLEGKKNPSKVYLHIYQARKSDPASSHCYEYTDFVEAWAKVAQAATRCGADDAELHVGEHCRYCRGRLGCPALNEANMGNLEVVRTYEHPVDITVESAAANLAMFQKIQDELKSSITGLEEFVLAKLRAGETSNHYVYAETLGNREWLMETEDIVTMGHAHGVELTTSKPVTPAQAERLGVSKELVASMTQRPSRGFKLKRASLRKAKKVFGD